jgi:ATPase subunit of ABC transporter with duplicated ATPase domains
VLGTVATLGVDPDRVLVTDAPSPGEARKLALARFLAGSASVLVLDEPTNHLDLPAIEQVESALDEYRHTVLLVSHDRRLIDEFHPTRRWTVIDGALTEEVV